MGGCTAVTYPRLTPLEILFFMYARRYRHRSLTSDMLAHNGGAKAIKTRDLTG
jgi:hypothetical protein